ncbi:MAG TPA: cysteine--tRNA ligase [Elusimicrobiota bacterium]|nr:cysteine--tRNA ligase [Elusimicrobiota bacterium]
MDPIKTLRFHDTLTGKKQQFEPALPGQVRMYVCGVTPYDECHLGHARCYVTFDLVRRVLEYCGHRVDYVQNFTDIDDKIIQRAAERHEDPAGLAERFIADYFEKMDRLNIRRARVYPRVTGHIDQIVKFIEGLVSNGAAYPVDGDVYYGVRRFDRYGRLAKRSVDDLKSGARVEVDERKKDPLDFALWKAAKPGEPSWPSPWGAGRPGWHIECSVMSLSNLDVDTLDIHGGGQDLIFPHHENEIAQAEALTGQPFARYWIHNGFVTINQEKMSKSLGNFFTLTNIFKKYDPLTVRWFLLSQPYRVPLDFSDEALEQIRHEVSRVKDAIRRVRSAAQKKKAAGENDDTVRAALGSFVQRFDESLRDDFNAPQGQAAFHSLLNTMVRSLEQPEVGSGILLESLDQSLRMMETVLGLKLDQTGGPALDEAEISRMIAARETARKNKDWADADRLRAELSRQGVLLEDTSSGTRWWRKD